MDQPAITYFTVTNSTLQIGGENSVGISDHTHLEESVEEIRTLVEDQDSVTRQLERDVDGNCNDIQELKNEVQLLTERIQNSEMDNQRLRQRVSNLERQNRRPSLQRISDNVADTNTDMSSVNNGDDTDELTDTDEEVGPVFNCPSSNSHGDDTDEGVGSVCNFPSSNTHDPVASIHPDVATCRQRRHTEHGMDLSQLGRRRQRLTLILEHWNARAISESQVSVVEVDDRMTVTELEFVMHTMVGTRAAICCINRQSEAGGPLFLHSLDFDKKLNYYSLQDSDTVFYIYR